MRAIVVVMVLAGIAPGVAAQSSSIFGVRGLGLPGRNASAHVRGLGGAFGLFDPTSNQNPAAIAQLLTVTAGFQLSPEWRSVKTPAGDATPQQTQFPLFMVAGPLRGTLFGAGITMGNYTSRDFQLVTRHTETIRGTPVDITDSLTSRGGMNDIRLAVSYLLGPSVDVGAALHVITGVNRMEQVRAFSDTAYLASRQSAELSYAGYGFSIGTVYRASGRFSLAASLRSDGKASVDVDSTSAYDVDLPYTVGLGFQFRPSEQIMTAAQATYRTWSAANTDVLEQGGPGSKNTLELNAGLEWARDGRRSWRRPLRLGVRYAQLPFLISPGGEQPREFGLSIGSGTRFAGQRGGVDLALERTWRSAGSSYKESAWMLVLGISVRPALQQ